MTNKINELNSKNDMENKTCYIYLLNGIADWEIGYLIAELNSKRYLSKSSNIDLKFVSYSLNPIKTMGGAIMEPQLELKNVKFNSGDILLLPGSDSWDSVQDEFLIKVLNNYQKENIIVASICGSTLFLANLGLLNNIKHTSNDLYYLKMVCPDYTGEAFYSTDNVVSSYNLITASSIAALEFTYEVLKKLEVMTSETLEAWYNLFNNKDPKYFMALMNSL
ncbi:MAG: DJ-1/PfpI family protein [Spirochaetales bacterium]|nr:DJ-1/PfpI family protein [Spirochaetales bacterium]